jgi:hypothetical protein
MAFEATRLSAIWARRMAVLACRDPGNQKVRSLGTRQRILMAAGAGKSAVRVVIES